MTTNVIHYHIYFTHHAHANATTEIANAHATTEPHQPRPISISKSISKNDINIITTSSSSSNDTSSSNQSSQTSISESAVNNNTVQTTQIKQFRFKCDRCDAGFNFKHHLINHLSRKKDCLMPVESPTTRGFSRMLNSTPTTKPSRESLLNILVPEKTPTTSAPTSVKLPTTYQCSR